MVKNKETKSKKIVVKKTTTAKIKTASTKKSVEIIKMEKTIASLKKHLEKNKHDVQSRFILNQLEIKYKMKLKTKI